jgi:signal transduction histidine kinase
MSRELLAALLTASGATGGALALTCADEGTVRRAPVLLATVGVDDTIVVSLLTEAEHSRSDVLMTSGHAWLLTTIPFGDPVPGPAHGARSCDADMVHVLLQWEGRDAQNQRACGEALIGALRNPIAAVVLSTLATERQIELERRADERPRSHLSAELLGTVSHDLRSPLAAIKGYAQTLLRHERRLPPEERHEFLSAIDEATTRLEMIINRLLELSELESGAALLHRDTLDLVPIASSAINDVRARLASDARPPTTFMLTLRDCDGGPAERELLILADARAIYDLLDHLLENAVKYSPQGGEISVMLRRMRRHPGDVPGLLASETASGPDFVELTVSDQGMGIPPDHLGRIFGRFHQVDTRLTRDVDSFGLGLAICRRLVELHGGAIWAESDPGVGSVFHVVLPLASQADQRVDQKER